MLVKVEVGTTQGDMLSLPLDDVTSGLILAEIEGLDPAKATLVSSSFAGADGEYYHSSRRETRNIKMKLELDVGAENTARELRKVLYKFLMPKTEVLLRFFHEDGLDVDIVGRVESLETALWSQEPAVDCSIICYDPDFIDPVPVVETGMSTSDINPRLITYDGSVETGIKVSVNITRPTLNEFTIYHQPPGGELRTLDFVAPLVAGDVLTISTVAGAKGATLLRTGTTSSVLYGVSPQANWIELEPGINQLRVYTDGVGVPVTVEYINKYGGL